MAFQYQFFSADKIKPLGWLKKQLELQAQGLNGNLDKVWPDIRDSRWVGGEREGWERLPYWLDGFIPLAFLLDNEDMKKRAANYIDHILNSQEPDGWICPCGSTPREKYDIWAAFLITKVLVNYESCTHEERIRTAVLRIMKNLYEMLSSQQISLFAWGKRRWFEAMITLNRLLEWYPDEAWITELAKILKAQGTDYEALKDRWVTPLNDWTLETHVVNIAMMLKYEAMSSDILGEPYTDRAEELWRHLYRHNGTPVGIVTGDECLSGTSPIQGSELCSVVEWMYSFEWLFARTGQARWAERLEKVAFNALPATLSDDMWSHQYDQMSNQIDCTPFGGKPIFRTNNQEAHIFGLEPNFGCCTANFGQGWSKFARSAFFQNDKEICMPIPLPAECSTAVNGTPIRITVTTEYPFRNSFSYRIDCDGDTEMQFRIRIPAGAKQITVNGQTAKKKNDLTVRLKKGTHCGSVSWTIAPQLRTAPSGLSYAQYGPLVFALPLKGTAKQVEYEKDHVERKYPYCDYHIKGEGDWSYGYASDRLTVAEQDGDPEVPFSSKDPRLVLKAELASIDWGFEEGYTTVCAKRPKHRTPLTDPCEKALFPYGCAKLRMTEMPKLKIKK